ncbi:MAG: family 78 glycoside hydrolase catalytic domain [Verrucomicrobia bacterium]|nr:family 78 glycoside hydrolase catalytic domain [Verrucomicrobiota bacterium]
MKTTLLSLTALLLAPLAALHAADVRGLRCEYRDNPLGIDVEKPRLSWVMEDLKSEILNPKSENRGQKQTAYQVLVASAPELLAKDKGDLWDSGKVASDQSILVEYAGKPLESLLRCHWKVRVWDKDGAVSAWSDRATWTMGLLTPEDWKAGWIGAVAKVEAQSSAADGVGYHAAEAAREDEEKWVQVDLGKSIAIERVVLHTLNHGDAGNPVKGFGFPIRFRIEVSDDAGFKTSKTIANQTGADYANPGHVAVPFRAGGATARYVRMVATKLWNRKRGDNPYCFALAQLEVISGGKNAALKAAVTAKDSVENWGWAKTNLTDGQRFASQKKDEPKGETANVSPSAGIQVRNEFALEKETRRAVVYICGLGQYELRLNGQKVGDRVLDPGWTNYRKTCLYTAYDVTAQLVRGRNAIGVLLGNGMYNVAGGRYVKFTGSLGPPKVILQLHVEYADGTSTVVVSDESWTWAPSPVIFSCIYGGEDYDARKEQPGWDKAGFNATAFHPVCVVDGPGGRLSAQGAPPIKVMKEYKPVKVTQPTPGVAVYDFGQNCASMPKLTVKGPAGASVRLTPGELLHDNGLVSQGSCGGPAYYTYTLNGAETETWTPRFFYYGSRYLQVETSGHDAGNAPQIVELTSQFVHSSAATVGSFTCANPLVNRVHDLINAAIMSNLQSVLTDCPHREKLGWLECAHLLAGCLMYNYDVPTFYTKIARDMGEAQLANGMVPDIAPEYTVFAGGFRDSPEWGSAYVITPWQVYQMYGDRTLLARHYDGMKRYVEYLKSTAKDSIVTHGLGDWYDIGPGGPGESKLTSKGLTATAIYYQDLVILKETAALLGKTDEASQFAEQARAVKEAFNRNFFNADKNQYDRNSQTANAMPLVLGLVPEDRRAAVLDGLVAQIRAGGNRVTAGDVGFNYLMRALSDGGQGDVLYDMLIRDDGPGYAYQLKKGATSLTEAWDTNPDSSQNHCMLGHIEEWFYRGLGGISSDPAGPGFKKIIVKPQLAGDLSGANVTYDSPYGRIVSNWKRDAGKLTMDVTIPGNTTSVVYVPAKDAAEVTESGKPAANAGGVKFLRMENNAAVYAVGSGTYRFQSSQEAK